MARGFWFPALLALFFVVGAAASAQTATATTDHAMWLVGTWTCESAAGSVGTNVFSSHAAGMISEENEYRLPNGQWFRGTQQFAYDSTSGRWTMSSPANGLWASFVGSASPWSGSSWEFDAPGRHVVYTMLSDDAFSVEWDRYLRGYWAPYSTAVCKRVGVD